MIFSKWCDCYVMRILEYLKLNDENKQWLNFYQLTLGNNNPISQIVSIHTSGMFVIVNIDKQINFENILIKSNI